MSQIQTIFWNIVGGISAGLILLFLEKLYHLSKSRRLKRFFGLDDDYYLIYCLYNTPECPKADPNCKLVFRKPPRESVMPKACSGINLQKVTSTASSTGLGYLVETFSKYVKKVPRIYSDIDPVITNKTDVSFVSVGGRTNYKTCDLLDNSSNKFLDFNRLTIISKKTKDCIVKLENAEPGYDFGFILKINPSSNLERTWICCCGFGITATIGASYYLSKKWKKIRKYTGNKPFGCVIKSKSGSEEETEATHILIVKTNLIVDWIRKFRARKNGLDVILL